MSRPSFSYLAVDPRRRGLAVGLLAPLRFSSRFSSLERHVKTQFRRLTPGVISLRWIWQRLYWNAEPLKDIWKYSLFVLTKSGPDSCSNAIMTAQSFSYPCFLVQVLRPTLRRTSALVTEWSQNWGHSAKLSC